MFNQNGLSLDQAPPISVVFRFFFSGGVFGILFGLLAMIFGVEIFDPNSPKALIITHTLTLGVMLSFMFAALFQMLPVIAGIKLTNPITKANLTQYPFIIGTLSLLIGFFTYSTIWFSIAGVLLGSSILYISSIMLSRLIRLQNHTNSSKGMGVSIASLFMLTLLALVMILMLSGVIDSSSYLIIKKAHYSLGLFGWIGLLIISISFQVIEMFYVTPPYPTLATRYLPYGIFSAIVSALFLALFGLDIFNILFWVLALTLIAYALLTLYRLTQRKRPIADATVWFWRVGMSSLILAMLCSIFGLSTLSYILFVSFALSIVFAMFYKIVPFLTWFHLNSQGYFTAPMMHEVIHPKTAMKHLYIHIANLLSFIVASFWSSFIYVAGILSIVSFAWLTYQIIHAHKLYKHTQTTSEKFDINME
jgi:hypothetical protein